MSLLSEAYEPFVFMVKNFTPDGEGGFASLSPTWTEGATIQATADFPQQTGTKIADAIRQKITCVVTTPKAITLQHNDVIKRVSDGIYFRITTDGTFRKTPKSATLDMRQSDAEVWELPASE